VTLYRFAVPASLMFDVEATSREAAFEAARRIVEACADGFSVGDLASGAGDEGNDARVYCPDNGPGAITLEDSCSDGDTEDT